MASRKANDWWKRQAGYTGLASTPTPKEKWWRKEGYLNPPSVPTPAPGRTGDAIMKGLKTSREIEGNTTSTQINNSPDSTYTGLWSEPGHPRTVRHEYYPDQHVMKVWWGSTPPGPPYFYYDVSPQEWFDFTNSESPGRWINRHDKQYGIAF